LKLHFISEVLGLQNFFFEIAFYIRGGVSENFDPVTPPGQLYVNLTARCRVDTK